MRQIDELRKAVRLLMQIGYPRRGTVEENQTLQDFADLIQREWSAERLGELLANLSGGVEKSHETRWQSGKDTPEASEESQPNAQLSGSKVSPRQSCGDSVPPAQNLSPETNLEQGVAERTMATAGRDRNAVTADKRSHTEGSNPSSLTLTPAQEKLCGERIDHWTVAPDNYSLWDFARELLALREPAPEAESFQDFIDHHHDAIVRSLNDHINRLNADNADLRRKLEELKPS
jgi:hypothetical protein